MIIEYAEVDMMRLLLLLIVMPLFLMPSSILTMASATTSNTTSPATVSNASSSQITPILLTPMATSGTNVYVVWLSNLTGHFEILFRVSSDNGHTFQSVLSLSDNGPIPVQENNNINSG